MRGKTIRREFLRRGFLAAAGVGLASCIRLSPTPSVTPVEPTQPPPTPPTLPPTSDTQPTRAKAVSATPSATAAPAPDGLHEARYYVQLDGDAIQCQMCFRTCVVPEGKRGFCRNKINVGGRYYTVVYGRPSALQIDPIEKEPAYHVLPGATIFCTGTASCNNRCKFCHNWHLSQRSFEQIAHVELSPEQTVQLAQGKYTALPSFVHVVGGPLDPNESERVISCDAVSFTYNEPTVFYEHMFDVARAAKEAGLAALFHTNGGMNEEPLAALLAYVDAVTVDLKAFTPTFYQEISSSELEPVLRTLQQIHRSGVHLEIVNLLVTTLNDDMDDIRRMCRWIRDTLSDEVPLHLNRFVPAYKLTSLPPTPIETLENAVDIADEEGLKYVYLGNYPGHARNSTFCPECGQRIIQRVHFSVLSLDVEKGKCRFCGHAIPGVWWHA